MRRRLAPYTIFLCGDCDRREVISIAPSSQKVMKRLGAAWCDAVVQLHKDADSFTEHASRSRVLEYVALFAFDVKLDKVKAPSAC